MISVGVIGLGAIGERLIQQFVSHQEVEVVAVCDVSEERARTIASKLGDIEWYTNYKELLNASSTDLIYVAVPPKFHYQICLDVIESGKHLLCEKPLANSVEEARVMMEKAESANIVHAMNFPLNYGRAAVGFAERIHNQEIGKLRRLELTMHFPEWPRAWQQNDWVASREQGGFVLEVGVHFIQQALKVFGPITFKYGQVEYPSEPQRSEIGITATLSLEDGTPFIINGLSDIAGNERIAYTAYGTEGTVSLVNWSVLEFGKLGEEIKVIETDGPSSSLVEQLVAAINGRDAELYDFRVGYEAQVILEKAKKYVNKKRWDQ